MLRLNFKFIIKITFIYTLLFIVFYLEPVNIGGIKFAILWKLPLVGFLAFYIYRKILIEKTIEKFLFWGILLSFKIFFSISSFEYISSTFSEFTKLIIFFLLFIYINDKFTYQQLVTFAKHLSAFIILSFVPFILGLIKPLGRTIEISTFGDTDANSLIGVFQNPHAAGITLSVSIIIILYTLLKSDSKFEKYLLFGLLIIGFIELFLTFVRTPLVMVMIGVFIISIKYFKLKHFIYLFLVSIMGIIFVYNSYESNPFLKSLEMRLKGENKYNSTGGVGSGRELFWKQAIINWQSEGITSITIGLGLELARDKMKDATGLRVFAHNGYLQQLQADGAIGLVLLLLMLFYMYKYINYFKNNEYFLLMKTLYFMYLISIFFQGGNYFMLYVFFSIYMSLLSKPKLKE